MGRALIFTIAIAAMLVGGAMAQAMGTIPKPETFRLRATATLLVDGVQRTGSSVQEYRLVWNYQPQIGNNGAWRLLARGEGIKIDIPNGRPIFVRIGAGIVFDNCSDRTKGQDEIRASLLRFQTCEAQSFPSAITFNGESPDPVYLGKTGGIESPYLSMSFERTEEPLTAGVMPKLPTDQKGLIHIHRDGLTHIFSNRDFKLEEFF